MDESCHPPEAERRKPDAFRVLAECETEFVRASGPGGQHRNRRETGVRLTHGPTGIVVMATERRSQVANRKLALERMIARLEKLARKKKPRKATKKSRGVRSREVDVKKRHGAKKAERKGKTEE